MVLLEFLLVFRFGERCHAQVSSALCGDPQVGGEGSESSCSLCL